MAKRKILFKFSCLFTSFFLFCLNVYSQLHIDREPVRADSVAYRLEAKQAAAFMTKQLLLTAEQAELFENLNFTFRLDLVMLKNSDDSSDEYMKNSKFLVEQYDAAIGQLLSVRQNTEYASFKEANKKPLPPDGPTPGKPVESEFPYRSKR